MDTQFLVCKEARHDWITELDFYTKSPPTLLMNCHVAFMPTG
jgi:hypothetical protein